MNGFDSVAMRAIDILWGVWILSWIIAAVWSDPAARRPPTRASIPYYLLTIFGFMLMMGQDVFRRPEPLWVLPMWLAWLMVWLVGTGFVFCWWARLHLGRLWSANVGAKAEHHVVDTGPYGLVRHPIYTGLILSAWATVIVSGWPSPVLGAALLTLGFFVKAQLEERFLRDTLGADAYESYRHRVPMLIPFSPIG